MLVGEFAAKSGLSHRTIRHYDELGLLKACGRTEGGFRIYGASDLTRVRIIRGMRALGFTHDEIRAYVDLADDASRSMNGIARLDAADMIADVERRRDILREQLEQADEFIEKLRHQ